MLIIGGPSFDNLSSRTTRFNLTQKDQLRFGQQKDFHSFSRAQIMGFGTDKTLFDAIRCNVCQKEARQVFKKGIIWYSIKPKKRRSVSLEATARAR